MNEERKHNNYVSMYPVCLHGIMDGKGIFSINKDDCFGGGSVVVN